MTTPQPLSPNAQKILDAHESAGIAGALQAFAQLLEEAASARTNPDIAIGINHARLRAALIANELENHHD